MGIITKEVEVRPTGKMIQYYKDKGYDAKYNRPLIVSVEDLQDGSDVKIQYLCDYCQNEILNIRYADYTCRTKEINKMACKKCSPQKVKETSLLRYGVDNYAKTKECQEKMETTMENRYGSKRALQNQDFINAFKNTCKERYGEDYSKYFTDKAFESFRDKAGYDFPSQSPNVREKITQSYVEHYGVNNPAKSPEIREKMTQTLYANSSQKASRQQLYVNTLYKGILNFPVKYYNIDIYLPDDNLTIEYDGGFHLGNIVTGRETMEEHIKKEIIRNNIIKREGYKQMRIISDKDLLPSDAILLQMLSEARTYFSTYPNHSWIEYNISTSTLRNAENPNGIFYDFGTLRRIKDSDINNVTDITNKDIQTIKNQQA